MLFLMGHTAVQRSVGEACFIEKFDVQQCLQERNLPLAEKARRDSGEVAPSGAQRRAHGPC